MQVLKPLPYRQPDRLVYVHNESPSSQLGHANDSGPDHADLTAHREPFSETSAYYFSDFSMSGLFGFPPGELVESTHSTCYERNKGQCQAQTPKALV